jgi:hypothetical protein
MSASNMQNDENEYGQVLDVPRLIEAVRGSRAAQVLFEFARHNASMCPVQFTPGTSEEQVVDWPPSEP